MKKIIILAIFAFLLMSAPTQAKANFNILDPFCLFSCKDEPAVVNNTNTTTNTNSNNVNSNVNSPNSNVVSGTPVVITNNTPVYSYDNNNNQGPLGVSCYSSPSSANVNDLVIWRASVYGGNGNYHITWSGTNGLSGNGTSVSIRYGSGGTKNASVTVISGNSTISKNCTSVEVYDYNYNNNNYNHNYNYNNDYYNNNYYNYNNYNQLIVSCYANTTFAPVGTRVNWQANVSGGNGVYSYSWYGTDNISGYNRDVEIYYNGPGTKSASVTVFSGGRSVSQTCSNTVLVGLPVTQYVNPYPTYTPPTTVIKYVPTPVKEVVKAPVVNDQAALISLASIPWGWVAVLIILILLFTVIYLVFTKNKI